MIRCAENGGRSLCHHCEQRFNQNGETWVIKHCYHEDGRFPLRDLLNVARPIVAGDNGRVYDASGISGIDINKLVYFGASIIWRASLREWRIQKEIYRPIESGPEYQEELRLYLLGKAPFPQNAASVVYVSTSDVPPLTAAYPDSLHSGGVHAHRFYVPGIWFHLATGDLTDDNRQMCILRSPRHPICMHVLGDALIHEIGFQLYWKSKARGLE